MNNFQNTCAIRTILDAMGLESATLGFVAPPCDQVIVTAPEMSRGAWQKLTAYSKVMHNRLCLFRRQNDLSYFEERGVHYDIVIEKILRECGLCNSLFTVMEATAVVLLDKKPGEKIAATLKKAILDVGGIIRAHFVYGDTFEMTGDMAPPVIKECETGSIRRPIERDDILNLSIMLARCASVDEFLAGI